MSVFAMKACLPQDTTSRIASWRDWKLTLENISGILSLIEEPEGLLRCTIILKVPDSFLGIRPMGLIWKRSKGGLGKGPNNLPASTSLLSAVATTCLLSRADFKLVTLRVLLGKPL